MVPVNQCFRGQFHLHNQCSSSDGRDGVGLWSVSLVQPRDILSAQEDFIDLSRCEGLKTCEEQMPKIKIFLPCVSMAVLS